MTMARESMRRAWRVNSDIVGILVVVWNACVWMLCSLVLLTQESEMLIPPCSGIYGACSSLLKLEDDNSNIITDGHYCNCTGCSLVWKDSGLNRLTWFHHERIDWVLQFQFCHDVISDRKCSSSEEQGVVATIKVNEDRWNPSLSYSQCHCPHNRYHMRRWEYIDGPAKGKGSWHYHFTCDIGKCRLGDTCLKHHMDSSASTTRDYHFMCSCSLGNHCPVAVPEQKLNSYEMDGIDSTGPFVYGRCQPIPGWNRGTKNKIKTNKENGFG